MERAAAEREMKRRLRGIGARLSSIPGDVDELLSLLQEAATLLYRVDQSQLDSMHGALIPVMGALIKKKLLEHTDPGVKLAVASCLIALTKIRAPDPPYDDDVMKDVLKLVVEAFCKLDDVDCPSYGTRVSMLETFARIRGCALLLDLNCNDLIRDMFHRFFQTISNTHQENVTSYMEIIMKLTIEETTDTEQDLIQDLAFCLLQNVKKEEQETLPASFVLAKRVIELCHEKLKPIFIKLLQGAPRNEYSNLVTSFLQDATDAGDNSADGFMHEKKEVVSIKSSTTMGKTKGQPAESGELKRKHVQETKEAPNSNKKVLDGSIGGSRTKVCWPADEMQHDRSDKGNLDEPFQDTHNAASNHSSAIQEKYNSVLNEIQCISTETTSALPVRISGWENCHLEPEKVSIVYAGQLPPATAHNPFAEKPQSFTELQHTSL